MKMDKIMKEMGNKRTDEQMDKSDNPLDGLMGMMPDMMGDIDKVKEILVKYLKIDLYYKIENGEISDKQENRIKDLLEDIKEFSEKK